MQPGTLNVPFFFFSLNENHSVTLVNSDVEDTYLVRFLPSDDPNTLFYEHLGKKEEAKIITHTIFSKDSAPEEFQVVQVNLLFFFIIQWQKKNYKRVFTKICKRQKKFLSILLFSMI